MLTTRATNALDFNMATDKMMGSVDARQQGFRLFFAFLLRMYTAELCPPFPQPNRPISSPSLSNNQDR